MYVCHAASRRMHRYTPLAFWPSASCAPTPFGRSENAGVKWSAGRGSDQFAISAFIGSLTLSEGGWESPLMPLAGLPPVDLLLCVDEDGEGGRLLRTFARCACGQRNADATFKVNIEMCLLTDVFRSLHRSAGNLDAREPVKARRTADEGGPPSSTAFSTRWRCGSRKWTR